jgi:hypothetical protein
MDLKAAALSAFEELTGFSPIPTAEEERKETSPQSAAEEVKNLLTFDFIDSIK